MAYALLLRFDVTGPCPVLVRDDQRLDRDDGVRYRFVAEAATWEDAEAIRQELQQQIEAREIEAGFVRGPGSLFLTRRTRGRQSPA
jgi:hypothetical protein